MRRNDEHEVLDDELEFASVPWAEGWSPVGVVNALEAMVSDERRARIREALERRLGSVTLVLDGPYDPHNSAAVLRSCDAFGVQELHVVVNQGFQVARRVAKGTERWVDVVRTTDAATLATALIGRGFQLVATHPEGRLVPEDLASLPKVALILGNEHQGVGPVLSGAAHDTVRIPMRGFVESLNMSVCAAILAAAATRNRPGDLAPADKERLYARGVYWSVNRARDILAALEPR